MKTASLMFASVISLAAPVTAATFTTEFWDVDVADPANPDPSDPTMPNFGSFSDPFNFQTDVLDVVATAPDLVFTVGLLDFPNNTSTPTPDVIRTVGSTVSGARPETARLKDFLGTEAGSVDSDDTAPIFVAGSIFRFIGLVKVEAGLNSFFVTSDDGFQLSLDGQVVSPSSATLPRGLGTTEVTYTSQSVDRIAFELLFYDSNVVGAGLYVSMESATGAPLTAAPIPLPASGILLLGGLIGAGFIGRRRAR